jgi:hypothetical protein
VNTAALGLEAADNAAKTDTLPCGVPLPEEDFTSMVASIGAPAWALLGEICREVVVGRKLMEFQLFTNTLASTDPRPLARSYPTPAE